MARSLRLQSSSPLPPRRASPPLSLPLSQPHLVTLPLLLTPPPKPLTYSRGQCTKLYSNPSGTLLAYGSSRLALLRPLFADSSTAEVRTFGHAQSVNVVKPVGEYYAASGDAGGNVKVRLSE